MDRDRRAFLAAGAAGVLGAALGSGCTFTPDFEHDGPDAPREAPLSKSPRIAWVLSSGGPRGFAHVGVLKALDTLRLKPDLLVGASAGSLVAVLYGGGLTLQRIEELALELSYPSLFRIAVASSGGERLSGGPIVDLVSSLLGDDRLERLLIPTACVCAEQGGSLVAFTAGSAGVAVRASSAIEGQMTPVRIRGRRYVDPDLYQPMPVRQARGLGAQRILAIDVSAHEDKAPSGSERYRAGDLRKRQLTAVDAREADLVLHPYFDYYVSFKRDFRERAIRAGFEATMAQAAALRALHSG